MIIKKLITIDVFYYIPKTLILNEFLWQLEDVVPEIPRVHQFLNYWKNNIDAKISEVLICHSKNEWRRVDWQI